MGKIARYLNQLIVGNVFDSPEILEAYSTDRSVLKIKPKVVALPESTDDIRKLMRFCYQLASKDIKFPVTVRGAGLDEMGADISNGLVISTEKMNRILEADKRERLVRVQAGMTLKELNTALSLNGLTIPVGGKDSETIGGLISNCPSDIYSGKYGGIMKYVERVEVVLPNGDILQTARLSKRAMKRQAGDKSTISGIYRKVGQLANSNADLIKVIQKNGNSSYGYPKIALASRKGSVDLLPLFFGAEGTLGIITEIILRAIPLEMQTRRVVATFKDFEMAQKFLDLANSLKPRELNLYDISILKTVEETGKKLSEITGKLESGFVVFAKFDRRINSCIKKVNSIKKLLPRSSKIIIESNKTRLTINEFENSLTSFIGQAKTGERVPLVTDFYLPADNLSGFLKDLEVLGKSLKLDLALYGSYSASNYSLRPKFNLEEEDVNKKALAFLRAGAFVIKRRDGTLTGGSPEGRVKAIVTNSEMPEAEKKLYTEIKQIFDRYNIMNPAAKLGADSKSTVKYFRTTGSGKIVV